MQIHKSWLTTWGVWVTVALGLSLGWVGNSAAEESPRPVQPGEAAQAAEAADAADAHQQEIHHWIERLGDKDYYVRQQAQSELSKYGFEAFDALTAATSHEDLEIASRARYLLRLMRVEWTAKNDPAEVKRLLTDYESLSMTAKLARLQLLAELPEGAGLPALCRLVRYEKSPLLSKYAAMQAIGRREANAPLPKELIDKLRKDLERSRRAAAIWLLAWLRFNEDPEAAVADWAKLAEAEQALLRNESAETKADIVAAMVRFQVDWLKRLGHNENAVAVMRRLVDLEDGDAESLMELLDWLVQQKAWQVIDELAARFGRQFRQNAVLLYGVAEAQAAQAKQQTAEETAQQAYKLNAGKDPEHLALHWMAADRLRQRGRFDWAQREYRYLIGGSGVNQLLVQMAYVSLAEMFHDQGNDLEAAQLYEELMAAAKKQKLPDEEIAGRAPGELRARMHYFYACHYQSKNDSAQEEENLRKAVESDPADIDALIASYRLSDLSADQRQKIVEMIKKAASELQEKIDDDPNDPKNYNEYAWLVGNTEGDLSLALKYAKKTVELSPRTGGYYDTLAHVYFHQGKYEIAVKQQTRAAELDPHSGLILRQLKVFRAKLEEQQKSQPQTAAEQKSP
jgi:hypothetical protein